VTLQEGQDQGIEIDLSVYRELFLEESQQHLGALREYLARLADDAADSTALREARRSAHTLKGMAYTMHYEDLGVLGKMLENQLESHSVLSSDQIRALFIGCDEFETGLKRLGEESGDDNLDSGSAGT
jgi:two-component system chemotaxis sensor kinase CheA